ncbi:hypothetical protein ILUMI_23987 [Ignelater luminosus]|uniref:Uncharacterized protein n=1 Tax=Ignelater luminosus TaxID=2038154 RepID=A0A8K0CB45_IGNLU|nr:hypothetical protein ILUMI_23987 [Ignelater luminosus]
MSWLGLEQAQTAVFAISDSDMKDENQIEEGDAVEHVDKDHETEGEDDDDEEASYHIKEKLKRNSKMRMCLGQKKTVHPQILTIPNIQKCSLKQERQLQQIGRGNCDSLNTKDNKAVAVRWYHNKVVNMASNLIEIEPQDEVRR